jgi:hypothetical protein
MNQYSKINPAANDEQASRNNMMDLWKESIERAGQARQTAPAVVKDDTDEAKTDLERKLRNPSEPCATCASRTYQDGSSDPGVSFKTPTHIPASMSATAVMGHEREHVTRNAAKAEEQGGTARSSVVLHRSKCPECGRTYVSGGTTTTTTSIPKEKQQKDPFAKGLDKLI